MGKRFRLPKGRPRIVTNGRHLRDMSADAIDALKQANSATPRIFRRGGIIVRLMRDGDAVVARELSPSALRGELERAADFVRLVDKHDVEGQPVPPPYDVVQDVLALPDFPFPELRGIIYAPVLLPEGRFLLTSGYEASTGLLADFESLGDVNAHAQMSPKEGLRLLREDLLGDFPFVDDSDRTHALAALLTPIIRRLLNGPAPLFAVTAFTPGTGKGLLVELICLIAFGRAPGVLAKPKLPDELRWAITGLLLEGHPAILLDNVTELQSEILSAALTSQFWQARLIGTGRTPRIANNASWFTTGNNIRFSDEIARRTIPIRLEAHLEHPEERAGFRHEDIRGWVKAHRSELVGACLAILGAWVTAGRPLGATRLGSFESWSGVLGGVFRVLGLGGFLGGRHGLREVDLEGDEWRVVLELWWETHGSTRIFASDLRAILEKHGLFPDLWEKRTPLAAAQRIAHALQGRLNRVYGGRRPRRGERDPKTKAFTYYIETIQAGRDPGGQPETPRNPDYNSNCETSPRTEKTQETKEQAR